MLTEVRDFAHLPFIIDEARKIEQQCRHAFLLANPLITIEDAEAMPALDAAIWTYKQGWITWRQLRLVHEVNRPAVLVAVELLTGASLEEDSTP